MEWFVVMGVVVVVGSALRLWRRRRRPGSAVPTPEGHEEGRRVELVVPDDSGFSIEARATAFIDPPLDLGLEITRRSPWDPGVGGVSIPIRGFADRYLVRADEEGRAAALLDSDLQRAIESVSETIAEVRLSDDRVVLAGQEPDGERDAWLNELRRRCAALADGVERASLRVPVATGLVRYLGQWSAWARTRGLEVGTAPLGAAGRLKDLETAAWFERVAQGRHRLRLRIDLGVEAQDLSQADREALADLARLGETEVRDGVLSLSCGLDHEPPELPPHMVDQAAAVAAGIRDRAQRAALGKSGPYR
ncbi:MAG: hypothetical protein HYY06_17700 [Deltaproteobacteria bacterium]|nr:hypothetical protein [Deltaproteobacteria bacterium]